MSHDELPRAGTGVAPLFTIRSFNSEFGEISLAQSQMLQSLQVAHAFTTRRGGVSRPPYNGLNMAFHTGDNPDAVRENRRRVGAALGIPMESWVAGDQVHGCAVHVATATDAGKGAYDQESALPQTDILITQTPGIMLASFYADCVPVVLVDPVSRSLGIAHCGWRGTRLEAPKLAVAAMSAYFGAKPGDIQVVIGPSIGPCCYEISPALASEFREQFGPDTVLGRQLDLRLANRRTLMGAGVKAENIHTAPWCTCCQSELFFSHRASGGHTGRMAALLGWPQEDRAG